jgi:hypothetical protein
MDAQPTVSYYTSGGLIYFSGLPGFFISLVRYIIQVVSMVKRIVHHPIFKKPVCPFKGCQHKKGLCIHDWIVAVVIGYGIVFLVFWYFGVIGFNL